MGIKSVLFETFLATSLYHKHRFRETYSYVDIETYAKFIVLSQRVRKLMYKLILEENKRDVYKL